MSKNRPNVNIRAYLQSIGSKGGKAKHPNKGFQSSEAAREAAKIKWARWRDQKRGNDNEPS